MPGRRLPKVFLALTATVFFTAGNAYGEPPQPEPAGKAVSAAETRGDDRFSEETHPSEDETAFALDRGEEEERGEANAAEGLEGNPPGEQFETAEEAPPLQRIAPELAAAVSPEEQIFLATTEIPRVRVVATAYTEGRESTGKTPGHPAYGVTASGVKVRRDRFSTIAADPREFPYGTVLFIPGYGFGVVADTGGLVRGKHIDLYVPSVREALYDWGRRTVEVYVLAWGTGKVEEEFLDRLNTSGLRALRDVQSREAAAQGRRILE
ncbi:3D domain-containing protein [Brockia lithotrophica]|uniref:3D (Asp-Asp-Asp) domain-containing protein n=1 Tax=Brockia lithotrophica TaxID=933949 RepID=A0A660KW68_9BACL|nr:3D domain-containing protein [Brockia lithotrophica]RKQ84692.1 3D (Asp-Asp-Asp) domain-containing protein [Brockia lithotrophica]